MTAAAASPHEIYMTDKVMRYLRSNPYPQDMPVEDYKFYREFMVSPGSARPTSQPLTRESRPSGPPEIWAAPTADAFAVKDIPARTAVLSENESPLFYESSVNQILAWRGVGKTLFGLGLADAMAGGGKILDFQADRPRQVLYVDGELPQAQLQERIRDIVAPENRANVHLFGPEMLSQPRGLNLLDKRDGDALRKLLEATRAEIIFLDSQSTLMSGDANKTEFQEGRQELLRSLRWMGLTIVELHHVGKSGLQRGLSRNDDILDVQMFLKQVADWDPADGLMFEMSYEKVRHAARLESGYQVTRSDGKWIRETSPDTIEAAGMFKEGKTVRDVSRKLGVSTGKAHKLKKLATKAGLIEPAIAVKIGE